MKKQLISIVFFVFLPTAWAQTLLPPRHELQSTLFITEVEGLTASSLNPAGLSVQPDDDGVLIGYDFYNVEDKGNIETAFSVGNLGFTYQEFPGLHDSAAHPFRLYGINLSVGGEFLSIGTFNKLIESGSAGDESRVFSIDAGFILQPIRGLALAGVARNLNEPEVTGYNFSRNYTAGMAFLLADEQIKLMAEGEWTNQTKSFENAYFRGALSISPVRGLEFRAGAFHTSGVTEHFFANLQIPFIGGLRLAGSARFNDEQEIVRYSTTLIIPLQTARF